MSNRSRAYQYKFRVNDQEKTRIDVNILDSKMSKERYLREMAINGVINVQDSRAIHYIKAELGKIGSNINQIARKVNTIGGVTRDDIKELKELKSKVEDIWLLVKLKQ
jgi:hypothetical protein